MLNHFFCRICICLMAVFAISCDKPQPEQSTAPKNPTATVTVAAAASLTGVLDELAPVLQEQTGIRMSINAGASGALAQQIIQGAPQDLFISANTKWMDELQTQGKIDPATRIDLVRNAVVLIAGSNVADAPASLEELSAYTGRLAIGEPESVPAGQYAKQVLTASGLWQQLEPRLLPAVDVRAVLAYVETGAAPIGIVYATDAASSSAARVVFDIPEHLHDPIVYPAAVLQEARDRDAAKRVLEFLQSPRAQEALQRAGFRPVAEAVEVGG